VTSIQFAPAMDFHWKVAAGGYEWVDSEKGRVLRAVDARQPGWNYSSDRYLREYRPLNERSGLFWEFAELDTTEEAIKKFADNSGLLGASPDLELGAQLGPIGVRPEPFAVWKREIEGLRDAMILWRVTTSGSKKLLRQLKAKLSPRDTPLAVQRYLHVDKKDPAMFLLGLLQRTTDLRLRKQVLTRVLFAGNNPRLNLVLQPQSLLGALWLQFAAAVDAQKSFSRCPRCGVMFEVSRDTSGKRRSARFCSVRCRVANYRGRIDRARQLKGEGTPVREIARALNTRIPTVHNWLENKDRV
jgi:hypothetical protein